MTSEEAIRELSMHLMQCGALMPIDWVNGHGEGSRFMEAYRMAMDALKEQTARPGLDEMVKLVRDISLQTYETKFNLSVLWCEYESGPCTAGGEFDCRDEWIEVCIRKWLEKPPEERWAQVKAQLGGKTDGAD